MQLGCNNTFPDLLSALNQAIRAVLFQVVTSETSTVTAEAAGSSPVVPANSFSYLQIGTFAAGLRFGLFSCACLDKPFLFGDVSSLMKALVMPMTFIIFFAQTPMIFLI